jgi:ATP-dependent helicase/nuclease subunit B
MIRIVESPAARDRLAAAETFLDELPSGSDVVIVGASRSAVDDLVRQVSARAAATFGLHRFSFTQLAARLAAPALALRGLAVCTGLGSEAVAARATCDALAADAIPFFAPVACCPGFGRTLAATVAELRGAGVRPQDLAGHSTAVAQLGVLLAHYETQLAQARLADRAALLRAAADAVATPGVDALVGLPLVLLDVPIETLGERELIAALCAASPHGLLTVPRGDRRTLDAVAPLGQVERAAAPPPDLGSSLARLQTYLFNDTEEPPRAAPDDCVRFFSAPGEGRETIEIARWILAEARAGTPLDQMAVFLRSPETYTALLETACRRAGIPVYFARGTRRPNPSGRAFLALLGCAADGLSAKRFAEYLSFGQVPELAADGAPPADRPIWTGPRDEAHGAAAAAAETAGDPLADAAAAGVVPPQGETDDAGDAVDTAPALAGTLNAPRHWEELLVEAAVIGGAERWTRRLHGLEHELQLQRAELASEEPESSRLGAIDRDLVNLAHLRRFALPVIERLDALPSSATWGEWLERLAQLAPLVLRRSQAVLEVIAELAPMAAVGPVGLDEVREVLAERLRVLADEPPKYRYGRVLVTTLDDARGRTFHVAFVPGLAERIFPQRPREDPLLLDGQRAALSSALPRQAERVDRERLLLRLAVGAAQRRVYLSYPRVDVAQGRPRVTSFYGLDVARAVEGDIPNVEAFERGVEAAGNARLGWPAPPDPAQAIDAAEHDLAMLWQLLHAAPSARVNGGAQYLLALNDHLARSLRTRFKRWDRAGKWSRFDGFVRVGPATRALLAHYRLTARPYSPSALERYATCPYRFFLSAMHRLAPRAAVAPLEQLDPLTRGKLFHRVQAETLRTLARDGALPITAARLADAEAVLGATLTAVADHFAEELAPPIPRVWQDEIAALRGDLVYWLRHLAEHADAWHPAHFELGFGLAPDDAHDPHSRPEPVVVSGGAQLRGSVDLIERAADGTALRVTDHKTGIDRSKDGLIIGGGEVLQPVLYGLAVEAALHLPVTEARLFFCTARGGFAERVVTLNERARTQGREVLDTIDRAIAEGFLPPAPLTDACGRCDFHIVCGPHEAERMRRKDPQRLADLTGLRQRP